MVVWAHYLTDSDFTTCQLRNRKSKISPWTKMAVNLVNSATTNQKLFRRASNFLICVYVHFSFSAVSSLRPCLWASKNYLFRETNRSKCVHSRILDGLQFFLRFLPSLHDYSFLWNTISLGTYENIVSKLVGCFKVSFAINCSILGNKFA